MFPHQNNIRERRVGQPPMAPQHLMGMPQQGPGLLIPCINGDKIINLGGMTALEFTSLFGREGCTTGVLMSMPTQQMQIMTPNHYTNQNSYATQGQGNVSAYVATQQIPTHKSNYHQTGYTHNNQVLIAKHTMNRYRNYRKDYSTTKDHVNYSLNNHNSHQNTFRNNEYNSNAFSGYNHGNYNGHYLAPVLKENFSKSSNSSHNMAISLKNKEETIRKEVKNVEKTSQECPAIAKNYVYGGKDKTPMCLINELARYNKIIHQYRLTDEQGPAHKKSFTVTLTLGTEEYTSEGPSIKKAQHSAAAEALSKTSYSHPTPKTNRNMHSGRSNITPTVELNALAMKRGEPAVYKLLESTHNQQIYQAQSSFTFRRAYGINRGFNRRGRNNFFSRGGRMHMRSYMQNMSYTVSLKVGCWEFFGEGISPQSARHDAASKALSQLRMLPIPEESTCPASKTNTNQEFECPIKSPVSLVHEIALRRNLNVAFEVVSERGPPHMKIFVTKCTVGDISATGQGNGKKMSKKRAAENILVELKKLPSLPPHFGLGSSNLSRFRRKFPPTKKRTRNVIKIIQERKIESEYGEDVNPVSRLIQIQQLKKEREPMYTLLEERGSSRKREFLMEVSLGQLKATGTGPNKKLAKKAAAQVLLNQMGYGKSDSLARPNSKALEGSQEIIKDRKVTFVDNEKGSQNNNTGGSAGRQLKPGIYVMSCDQHCSSTNSQVTPINMQTTATIARELLKGGNSPTADALLKSSSTMPKPTSQAKSHSFRPKDQLLYLAELLNFEIHFSDFPKGSHSEYLSLVTMSTDPSHVCHGSGASIEESQDQAALTALTALSEMGLDSITNKTSSKDIKKDGSLKGLPQIKK